jgi:hypothetical protein
MPLRPALRKCGTIAEGVVEATPVVWQDKLCRFEWVRPNTWGDGHEDRTEGYYHFVDMQTEQEVGKPFAHAHSFGCAYEENGIMYVHGVRGSNGGTNVIDVLWSRDLCRWECQTALVLDDDLRIFNTSVCRGKDGYVMTVEVSGPETKVGVPFTVFFATSPDLKNWTLLSTDEHIFLRERYTACPSVRYYDGWYYIVYLERLPFNRWTPYIVRSRDLATFEAGLKNPFMMFDDADKCPLGEERFDAASLAKMQNAVNCNNSDVDFCDFEGSTVILYSWGNQMGTEYLARAEYDGSLQELLESYFES